MKIATWNVNSVRVREARLVAFLGREQPDALCLQELKVVDDDFPHDAVRAAGYEAVTFGQKTYNGVGILAKKGTAIANVSRTFEDGENDPQARLIAADILGVRVVSIYVPTALNPTSGFLVFARESDILDPRLSVEEGIKLVVSGGVVRPPGN